MLISSLTTSISSNSYNSSPISWNFSCPLPNTSRVLLPSRSFTPLLIASLLFKMISTFFLRSIPSSICFDISSWSSFLGLSLVIIIYSAFWEAVPINFLFDLSRFPPAPKTTITSFLYLSFVYLITFSIASGVWE